METSAYNILHITDLHFTHRGDAGREQKEVIKALLADIENLISGGLKPDLIIFNGDAVQNADEKGVYWDLTESLFEPLLQKCRLNGSNLLVVPGNHDVMRTGAFKHAAVHREFMHKFTVSDTEKFFYEDVSSGVQKDKFVTYDEFVELNSAHSVGSKHDFDVIEIESLSTAFCLMNTAYSSAGGHPEIERDEYGKLVLAPTRVRQAAEDIAKTSMPLRVFIGHHPREWFKEDCGRPFEREVIQGFDVHFAGHVHLNDPNTISSSNGSCLRVQTGALHDNTVPWNGFSVVRIAPNEKKYEIRPYRYIVDQHRFVVANEIGEDGIYYPSPADRAFWKARPAINRKAIAGWISESLLPHFKGRHGDTLTGQSLKDVFQEHPMQTRLSDFEDTSIPKDFETDITFAQMCASSENYSIIGDNNFGKSTFIRRLALELMDRCVLKDSVTIPALFDFKDITETGEGVLKAIRSAAPDIEAVVPLRQLLSEGLVTIIIDDINPRDDKRFKALMKFTEQYPRGRYIFTAHPVKGTALPLTESFDQAVSFKEIALMPLKTRGIRAFAEKHFSELEPASCDRLVTKIVSTLRQAALPPTAFSVSVLLAVITDIDNDILINEVNLIERFVEYLLKRERAVETARSTFNFADKLRCLAFVAEKMVRAGEYDLSYDDLLAYVEQYIFDIGYAHPADQILNRFIDQKVFRQTESGLYRFYLRAFLEYFSAQRMSYSPEFYDWIMEPSRYLSYVHEIEFYCGLPNNQNDQATLMTIAERHDKIVAESKTASLANFANFDTVELPSDKDGSRFSEVTEQLKIPKLTLEERDARVDAEIALTTTTQDAYRPDVSGSGNREFLSLTLYSSALRNLEHLRREEKDAHLKSILDSWVVYMIQAFALIPNIVKHRSYRVNGITYRTFAPSAVSDEKLTRMLMLYLPSGSSSVMRSYLGTEKLVRQFEFDTDGSEPSIIKIMRLFMLADLDTANWPALALKMKKQFHGKTYLSGALMWKLNTIIKLREIAPEKQTRVIEILARMSAEDSSNDPAQISKAYSRRLTELQNSLRVRNLHQKAEMRSVKITMSSDTREVGDSSIY
ncbi:calcineurin-like phosphoesterase family protein [Sphingomonas sp. PP-CE-3G-477]|nr:calcineurin-like phosphoesterase family protein [Sphingomonas sp. PP-CE-3G-477]